MVRKVRADTAEAALRSQHRIQARLEKDLAAASSKSPPQSELERKVRDLEDKLAIQVNYIIACPYITKLDGRKRRAQGKLASVNSRERR